MNATCDELDLSSHRKCSYYSDILKYNKLRAYQEKLKTRDTTKDV